MASSIASTSSRQPRMRSLNAQPTASSSRASNRPATPEYEPLSMPLTATAQRALESLLLSKQFRMVKGHIQQATDKLTEIAGEANERATDARHRFNASSSRGKKATKAEMKATTAQLEERMRGLVDAEYKLGGLHAAVQELTQNAQAAGAALNATRRRARLRERVGRRDADGDEEMDAAEDEEDEDEDEDEDMAPTLVPSQVLAEKLETHKAQWESQSLTERYSSNNTYVGFYRIVHDAKHPGNETPPVPHPSTWFNHLEQRQIPPASSSSSRTTAAFNNQARHQDRDDVEIERERISLKCPLTLRTFEDPVKNSKCVHSFERMAIQDMIKASPMTIPAGPNDFQGGGAAGRNARARRVRAAPCPVCSEALTLNDLEPDLVLLRRVRRARAAELREQEEAEFGGGRRKGLHGRSSGVTIDSDDSDDDDDDDDSESEEDREARQVQEQERIRIKRERSSRAPTAADDESEDSND
ncbi:hypothetical protein UA08_08567 [Talaromyces atroroseus]|uniref:SP-RING-type domain-containing protein n=1 Tax=Talaromyces atroroseus TaxID=1441469 RepID=A0A1Q5Q7J8_TALAT|nr:hypothetical protein UA08_08567 [Talaromyces atroroseus]OKL56183.1 hypothetical protein UA08_08567 [Talaromyces atroroseus]